MNSKYRHIIWVLFLGCWILTSLNGQSSISAYTWWLDDDHVNAVSGQGSGGSVEQFIESVDGSDLEAGIHFFNMRFRDDSARWSPVFSHAFYKLAASALPSEKQISKLEYWIDEGEASAYIPIIQSDVITLTETFNLDTLDEGIHSFNIRAFDHSGKWSSVMTQLFYISPLDELPVPSELLRAQSWIDHGPFQDYDLSGAGNIYTLSEVFQMDTLSDGVHAFNVRFLDTDKKWSSVYSHLFYKSAYVEGIDHRQVNYAEYWVDDTQHIYQQSVSPTASYVYLNNMSLDTLSNGVHTFNIRFRDDSAQWSSVHTHLFYKTGLAEIAGNNQLVFAEYWLNDSPTKHSSNVAATTDLIFIEELLLDTLPQGIHTINLRFRDDSSRWSSVYSHLFYKIATEQHSVGGGIRKMQYWIDHHADSIQETTVGEVQNHNFILSLDLGYLEDGIHALNCRFLDDQNRISSVMSHLFYKIQNETPDSSNFITSYRIIYDNDPELVQVIKLEEPYENPLFFNASIPAPIMEPGDHIVALQFKDQSGYWSSVFSDTILTDSIPQKLELVAGWNLISLNIYPTNRDMMVIVQPLIDSEQLIKVQDEKGLALLQIPGESEWTNGIGDWMETEGYRINVNQNHQLKVFGDLIELPVTVQLSSGWNIIGYPPRTAQPAKKLIDSLIMHNTFVKMQDERGKAIEYIPGTDILIDNIGDALPGEGYLVRVLQDDSITIHQPGYQPAGELKSAISRFSEPVFFEKVWSGNGYNHMNVYINNLGAFGSILIPGDEVAVFDDELCVGVAILEDSGQEFISVITSADDPVTDAVDGFTQGNPIKLKIWHNESLYEIESLIFNPASLNSYEEGGSVAITFNEEELTGLYGEEKISAMLAYPNPFTREIYIRCHLVEAMALKVDICNMLGQVVYSIFEQFPAGIQNLTWNGESETGQRLTPGIYYIKIYSNTDSVTRTMKVIKVER